MLKETNEESIQKTARFAGIMFLFCLIFPILNLTFVLSKLPIQENAIATGNNISINDLPFRFSIINDLISSLSVIIFALTLYSLLKPVNKNLALFALFLHLTEAVILAVIGLLGYSVLLILNGGTFLTGLTIEQMRIPAGFYIKAHTFLIASFPMLFLGLGLTVYNYLFFKSRFIPKSIAIFGILSYLLILIYAFINILLPAYNNLIQIICWTPSIIFELIIGLWLLIKGVNIKDSKIF